MTDTNSLLVSIRVPLAVIDTDQHAYDQQLPLLVARPGVLSPHNYMHSACREGQGQYVPLESVPPTNHSMAEMQRNHSRIGYITSAIKTS